MRILLVTYWGLTNMGGIWTYMSQLAAKLREQGHTVTLMGSNAENQTLYLLDNNFSFDKKAFYSTLLPHLDPLNYPHLHAEHGIFSFELGRYVFEGGAAYLGLDGYDIIHAQDPIASYAVRRILKEPVPLITSVHGALAREAYYEYKALEPELTPEEYAGRPIWGYFRRMEALGAEAADMVLVSSQWIGQLVNELGALEKRVRTIPYGIDVSQYDAKAQMVSSVIPATGCKVIMYAGRLEYIKGVHVLMLALGMLHSLRQDWICVLAGIGSLEEPLKAQATELGIAERVVFAGKVDNIPAALAGADLYVQPSLQDTQPYSVTEAQLAGIAPIVSGTAGMPEMVIPGETGWIVPPEDAAALAERLAALLADDQLRARTGRCAREWAASCRSLDVMTARTLQAYHDTIACHALQQAEGIYHNSLSMAGEAGAASLPGAFHPAEVLQPTEQGKILASILRHRLPAAYSIPDARILARFRPSVHE